MSALDMFWWILVLAVVFSGWWIHRDRTSASLEEDAGEDCPAGDEQPEASQDEAPVEPPKDLAVELRRMFQSPTEMARDYAKGGLVAEGDAVNPEGDDSRDELYALVAELAAFFNASAHPRDLLQNSTFAKAVALLGGEAYSIDDLLTYYRGDNAIVACVALEALARREPDKAIARAVLSSINDFIPWTRYFALRALRAHGRDQNLISRVFHTINLSWLDGPFSIRFLGEFLEERLASGEQPTLGKNHNVGGEDRAKELEELLGILNLDELEPIRREIRASRERDVDIPFLRSVGKVWSADDPSLREYLEHERLENDLADLDRILRSSARRSVLVFGEQGSGKTTLVRALGRRLLDEGWVIFEAGHGELLAGQSYIGQLEDRVKKVLATIRRKKVLWYIPAFDELRWTGRHNQSEVSVLDGLLPFIGRGDILVVGECNAAAYQQLLLDQPRCRTFFEPYKVEPMRGRETIELARRWAAKKSGGSWLPRSVLEEAWQLTDQFLSDRSAPANLLGLLDATWRKVSLQKTAERVTTQDVIETLTQLTGLPASILDERQSLDLEELRNVFNRSVIGQPEAVDCLVQRVAMIKAGLTDPTRPQGVFLFVGPTGTGKTEIAKVLARFLFGSEKRLLRVDMSELQTAESMSRLVGDPGGPRMHALVDSIREHPFSVVLLDEFEKAHENVWDLFLQVFDDGRLTDRQGRTADFRHAIIIMTSNLGAAVPRSGVGFGAGKEAWRPGPIKKALEGAFRREFLNRIDRIVTFRPLSRATMRDILRKELSAAFQRRGLRRRDWAVEWGDSAVEFLLDQGFTEDLGARPLKRAIEEHLLAQLAVTIVQHQFPEGDQFLFVRSDGKSLQVEFVDPDEAAAEEAPARGERAPRDLQLEDIVLEAHGSAAEMEALHDRLVELRKTIEAEAWSDAKQHDLEAMSESDFWQSPGRFDVLARVELVDRIEAGIGRAGSLVARMRPTGGETRARYPREIVGRAAQQLYLLERAAQSVIEDQPYDAFVELQCEGNPSAASEAGKRFARNLAQMYRNWAKRRRMKVTVLEDGRSNGAAGVTWRAAISGYAAYSILEGESGLHVYEESNERMRGLNDVKALVRVVAQPNQPVSGLEGLRAQAEAAFGEAGEAPSEIVRRYKGEPSPLVRDKRKGWRTGRLDRVLDGEFDVFR